MAKTAKRIIAKDYSRREFIPIATAVGQVALAWNDLQEKLGILFWKLLGSGEGLEVLAAWHSIKSDRAQRDMLKAYVKAMRWDGSKIKLAGAIDWLLSEANALEDARNDAIHSPLFLYDSMIARALGIVGVQPAHHMGHPRARKLLNKTDLAGEFRWYRDRAMVLADYAHKLSWAMDDKQRPWPAKPSRPAQRRKRTPRGQRRQSNSK